VGNGRTVEQQINEEYGVSDNAVRAESSYERTLPLERYGIEAKESNRGAGSRTAVGFSRTRKPESRGRRQKSQQSEIFRNMV
jgi:hypothetical protein